MVSIFVYFHPYLGKWSNLTNIFQMGWDHQLVPFQIVCDCRWLDTPKLTSDKQHQTSGFPKGILWVTWPKKRARRAINGGKPTMPVGNHSELESHGCHGIDPSPIQHLKFVGICPMRLVYLPTCLVDLLIGKCQSDSLGFSVTFGCYLFRLTPLGNVFPSMFQMAPQKKTLKALNTTNQTQKK